MYFWLDLSRRIPRSRDSRDCERMLDCILSTSLEISTSPPSHKSIGIMINKSLERRPDTRPLNRHPTKGSKIFFIQKKTHSIFRGAPTLLYKKLSYKMNHYWGEEWHTCKDHIVPILSRSRLLKILLEQSTDLRTCKVIVSPWYDTDYGG